MDDIDIDELTVEELIMLLDRSLDPELPVPVLMKAGQRLAELDPRVMPARPAPLQRASAQLASAHLASTQLASARLASAQSVPAAAPVPEPRPEPEPVS